jgi:branched-chain amino acid transport system permease protein
VELFLNEIANGLFVGAFFALVAVGYSMVYGILRLINFAHGDFFMVAAFVSYTILGAVAVGHAHMVWFTVIWVGLLVMFLTGLLAVLANRLIYHPMRRAALLSLMIAALGLSQVLENGVLNIPGWGSAFLTYPVTSPPNGFTVGPTHFTWFQLIIVVISGLLSLGVYLLVSRTLLGKAMRAVSEDRIAAALMGINVDLVIAVVFFIGGALAGAAAVMTGVYYGQINYLMGWTVGLEAFTAAVLGGIGNIGGAVLGGVVLGIAQSVGTGFFGAEWALVVTFVVLVLLLWLRPTGILGERVARRM